MSIECASSLNDRLSPRQRSSDSQVSCLFPSSVDIVTSTLIEMVQLAVSPADTAYQNQENDVKCISTWKGTKIAYVHPFQNSNHFFVAEMVSE